MCNFTLNLYAKEDTVIKNDYVELSIETDQEKYKRDEKITVTIIAKNISTTEINAIEIENVLPENMTIVDESLAKLSQDKLVPGETIVLKNVILQSSALNTGDDTSIELYVVLLILSVVLAFITKKKNETGQYFYDFFDDDVSGISHIDASDKEQLVVKKTIEIAVDKTVLKGVIEYNQVIENIDNTIILNINKDNLILSDDVYLLKDGISSLNGTVEPVD